MRSNLLAGLALVGILFMLIGTATTYIALGQDGDGTATPTETLVPSVTPATQPPTATIESATTVAPSPTVIEPTQTPSSTPTLTAETVEHIDETGATSTITPAENVDPAPTMTMTATEGDSPLTPTVEPTVENVDPAPTMTMTATEGDSPSTPTVEPTVENVDPAPTMTIPVTEGDSPLTPTVEPTANVDPAPTSTNVATEGDSPFTPTVEPTANVDPAPTMTLTATDSMPPSSATQVVETLLPPTTLSADEMTLENGFAPTVPVDVEATTTATGETPTGVSPSLITGQVIVEAEVVVNLVSPAGETLAQMTDAEGRFRFEVTNPGNYRLEASAPGFISRQADFTLDPDQQLELPPTTLNSGDLNEDNRIDLEDVVLVAANYDGPATVNLADLNGDGWIDIHDLTLIGSQFGLAGPLPWDPL